MSTEGRVSVPDARAPIAQSPPIMFISPATARCIAAMVAAGAARDRGGVVATTLSTPATFAVTALLWAETAIG